MTPWTVAYQASPSMGFSRQECWSGLPFPSPEDLPDPGIEPRSPALEADAVREFILGGFKITVDGDYSHDFKRHLLLGRKAMTKLENILKSRDITLQTKVCLVKAMVFPSDHIWM